MTDSQLIEQREKEGRGRFLTTVLVFQTILGVLEIFQGVYTFIHPASIAFDSPVYTNSMNALIVTLFLITIPLLWKWNKIGVYGLLLLLLVQVGNSVFKLLQVMPLSIQQSRMHFSVTLTEIVLFYLLFSIPYLWAIKRKWHLFR